VVPKILFARPSQPQSVHGQHDGQHQHLGSAAWMNVQDQAVNITLFMVNIMSKWSTWNFLQDPKFERI
jgi:hypothetical protein